MINLIWHTKTQTMGKYDLCSNKQFWTDFTRNSSTHPTIIFVFIFYLKFLWHLQQTVLAITLSAIVESSPPQNPSNAMDKEVPPVLDGDGMIAQSNPVAVLPQSVL